MPFEIVRNDITKMEVDAIVNAANPQLKMGGGVCGAIFHAAGAAELQAACDALAPIQVGEAALTPGFGLPAKHIIHAAGPIYRGGTHGEEALLKACYRNSLELAKRAGCESVAFPLISSGIYGYPKDEALRVARGAISEFLAGHEMTVYLAVFDRAAFELSEKLLGEVADYIGENYVDERALLDRRRRIERFDAPRAAETAAPSMAPSAPSYALDNLTARLDESFSQALLKLIDLKGRTDVEVYKRANIDRKHFSKIRSNPSYMPSRRTAVALAVALELTLPEALELLSRAGYALSKSRMFDVIIEYFLENRKYDVFEINEVLFHYDQPLLGG